MLSTSSFDYQIVLISHSCYFWLWSTDLIIHCKCILYAYWVAGSIFRLFFSLTDYIIYRFSLPQDTSYLQTRHKPIKGLTLQGKNLLFRLDLLSLIPVHLEVCVNNPILWVVTTRPHCIIYHSEFCSLNFNNWNSLITHRYSKAIVVLKK